MVGPRLPSAKTTQPKTVPSKATGSGLEPGRFRGQQLRFAARHRYERQSAGRNESVGENEEEFFVRATVPKGESVEAYEHMTDLAYVLLAQS